MSADAGGCGRRFGRVNLYDGLRTESGNGWRGGRPLPIGSRCSPASTSFPGSSRAASL